MIRWPHSGYWNQSASDRRHLPPTYPLWEQIRGEFNLTALGQVRERLSAVHEDPEPIMQQLVRVFIDEGTYCPGFQFHPDLSLNMAVVGLFQRAMELRIPHNYFALWIMTPCRSPPRSAPGGPAGAQRSFDAAGSFGADVAA